MFYETTLPGIRVEIYLKLQKQYKPTYDSRLFYYMKV
jgi:hypothetical protein